MFKERSFYTILLNFYYGKYLKITDRKKEMFKTSGGKYIAPQPIEQGIKESPFVEQIMVIGENRKYTAALIVRLTLIRDPFPRVVATITRSPCRVFGFYPLDAQPRRSVPRK